MQPAFDGKPYITGRDLLTNNSAQGARLETIQISISYWWRRSQCDHPMHVQWTTARRTGSCAALRGATARGASSSTHFAPRICNKPRCAYARPGRRHNFMTRGHDDLFQPSLAGATPLAARRRRRPHRRRWVRAPREAASQTDEMSPRKVRAREIRSGHSTALWADSPRLNQLPALQVL